jgi:outer membrane protein assembly factor BamA
VPTLEPPPQLGAFVGQRIVRIAVVLEGNIWDDVQAPSVRTVKPGESLTPALARRALGEVLATGRFARGRVSASPAAPGVDGGGVVLAVRVVPRKLIGRLEIDLHGARVDVDEVLRASGLVDGGEIVGADIDQTTSRIAQLFALHGYPSAIVDVQTRETDDPTRALVLVDVKPGVERVVNERRFYVFDADSDAVMRVTGAYPVHEGDRADEPALDAADVALEQALRAKGWYRADVSHDLVWVGDPARGGRVVLRVRIDAGPQQVARFEGNEHYDHRALLGALGLDTETDRSPSHLADKVRLFYQKRGFLDAQVRAEVRGGDKDAVQLVVFHVDEHPRVRVVSRHYPCLKLDTVRRLSGGGPRSSAEIGTEIDSFLQEDLPGADLLVDPDPAGVSATFAGAGGPMATGARPEPLDLRPNAAYVADTYERAISHVQELYRNEGFLHAQVGPVQLVRARCDPRSPPNRCVPMPLPSLPTQLCTYDPTGLPMPVQPLGPEFTCQPDPDHGVECAKTMQLIIPVKLGPRTTLWDVAFTGVRSVSEQDVGAAAALPLGDPVSTAKLDDARRRIVDWYKELGYAYVDVKYALEASADNTRARVRFDVTEGDQVIVREIVIRGLDATRESVVRRRVAIEVGQPYRTSDVRKTQERIATLGVFSSVNVSLSDPYIPAASKTVIIDVVERPAQYIELRPGFSTGEGVRGTIEYGHRNLLGYAWGITVHLQASYLPDVLIVDPAVYQNYHPLNTADRIATRDTVTLSWPEMGLGPTVRAQLDGIYVRDLERDFTLFKGAGIGTLIWRPVRELQVTGGGSYERNTVHLFDYATIAQFFSSSNPLASNSDLQRLLRVPDGDSYVYSQRVVVTWDRRDTAFNAHRGTYFAGSIEHADSFPSSTPGLANLQFESHILRLTQTIAGYIPVGRSVAFAAELRLGEIVNVSSCTTPFAPAGTGAPTYCTYPDRLFFMGGFDSMRGWLQDSFIPQEFADQIAKGNLICTSSTNCPGVPLRGGNLMINPRFELRFPVVAPVDGALFTDFGNLWNEPSYIYDNRFTLRADVGAGVRLQTPVGPLVFDYGINVTRRSYEDFGAFHFAIGLF